MVLKAMKNSLEKNVRKNLFVKRNSMKKTNLDKKISRNFPKFLSSDIFQRSCEKTMFFMFRTHLIHQPFESNATSFTTQQLLLCYQIQQFDRHHFPVTGILLILFNCLDGFLYSTSKKIYFQMTIYTLI